MLTYIAFTVIVYTLLVVTWTNRRSNKMKKLLTLVFALALTLALAAPALAITGDITPDSTNPKHAPVALSVELFTAPEYLLSGDLVLTNIAANKMYVVNEAVFWGVAMQFAEDDDDHDLTLMPDDYKGAVLIVSCDAFALKDVAAGHAYAEEAGSSKVVKWNSAVGEDPDAGMDFDPPELGDGVDYKEEDLVLEIPDYLWETDTELYFFGQGVVKEKGILTAKIVKDAAVPLNFYDGEDLIYTVIGAEKAAWTVISGGDGDGTVDSNEAYVRFVLDDENEVEEIFAVDAVGNGGSVEFKKLISGNGSIVISIGGLVEDDVFFDELYELYDDVMTFFGFNYDAEGKLLLKHFISKSNLLNLKDQAEVNLYTGSIALPYGPEVPKTGDAASVFGFAMIALALVAAGTVVSRKIRA